MKNKPEIPEEEILSYMDFDQLMQDHKNLLVRRSKFNFLNKIIIVSFAIITIPALWYFYYDTKINNDEAQSVSEAMSPQSHGDLQKSNQSDNEMDQLIGPQKTDDTSKHKFSPDYKERKISSPVEQTPPIIAEEEQKADTEIEYNFVEAQPVDGYPNLYEYFNRKLKYPDEGLRDSIQGVVTVSFVINEAGEPEKIEIKNSLGEAFDREVKNVIQNMPAWKPASVNGRPVSTTLAIPLTFQIKRTEVK